MTPAKDGGVRPRGHHDLYGTGDIPDDPAIGEQRRGRCYELSAYALALGSAPADAVLVHGSIDGGSSLGRFGHAWLRLADGRIWEPKDANVYPASWMIWADAREEVTYTRAEARVRCFTEGHYGPWHDASEHREVSEREHTEGAIPYNQRQR